MHVLASATLALAAAPSLSWALIDPFHKPNIISGIWQAIGLPDLAAPFKTTLQLNEADLDGLAARMEAIALEGSGNWLSDDDLKAYVSPKPEVVSTVVKYLTSRGVDPNSITTSKFGDQITFISSIGTQQSLFKTKFENFKLNQGDGIVVPRAKNYTIPAPLAQIVKSAWPISSFGVPKPFVPIVTNDDFPAHEVDEQSFFARDTAVSCNNTAVTPACLRGVYKTSSYTPKSSLDRAISVVSLIGQNYNSGDLRKFLQQLRPEAAAVSVPWKDVKGGFTIPFFTGGVEVMLDIETTVSQTYPLKNDIVNYGNAMTSGDLFNQIAQYYLNLPQSQRPGVISISYGADEGSFSAAEAQTMCASMQKLTASGTTVVVASGDKGVAGTSGGRCSAAGSKFVPTYPSECPYVLSVGATEQLPQERMVSLATSRFTSGAGFSNVFARPDFQGGKVSKYVSLLGSTNAGQYNREGRSYPDLVAAGSNYVVYVNKKFVTVGGTSAACPTVASIFALLNDARKQAGKGRVGYVQPVLYANPSAFHDVSQGGSTQCGPSGTSGFTASFGFDTSSGLGSPRFDKLRTVFGV